ncbi:hypothetical protein [Catelliglobosispora koreensis]|uniref:hypothetical protein n=1 Tax=Catelliglobosispora koreensis TaxID=129052 RepID=UPI0003820C70|nr:hypothetical protein [Catelliglobosispora koreensis]
MDRTITLPITIEIHYPPDLPTLTRWSHWLFAAYYVSGFTGSALFFGPGLSAWLFGISWWWLLLMPLGLLFSYATQGFEYLMSQVDRRRYEQIAFAQLARDSGLD